MDYYSWVLLAFVVIWLGRQYRIKNHHSIYAIAVHLLASVGFALFHLLIITVTVKVVKPYAFPELNFGQLYMSSFLRLLYFEILVYWGVLGLSYGFDYYLASEAIRQKKHSFSPTYLSNIPVKRNGGTLFLKVSQIDWLAAADNYVQLHIGQDSFLHREKMHVLENQFDPRQFQRIHRSTIVNLARVKGVVRLKKDCYAVVLLDGTRLAVSRQGRKQLEGLIAEAR